MIHLPARHSKKWAFVTLGLFLLTFVAMISVSLILKTAIAAQNIAGFALFSFFVSIVISLGGFLGAKAYFFTALVLDIIGIIYMLILSITKYAEGWSDLVSIISYMLMLGIGIILGIVIQLIVFIRTKTKARS
jgi:hypothetical protein